MQTAACIPPESSIAPLNRHSLRAEATNGFPFSNRNENVRQGSSKGHAKQTACRKYRGPNLRRFPAFAASHNALLYDTEPQLAAFEIPIRCIAIHIKLWSAIHTDKWPSPARIPKSSSGPANRRSARRSLVPNRCPRNSQPSTSGNTRLARCAAGLSVRS